MRRWYCIVYQQRVWTVASSHCCRHSALEAAWKLQAKVYVAKCGALHELWAPFRDGSEPKVSRSCFLLERL